jgi:hypothetical protein
MGASKIFSKFAKLLDRTTVDLPAINTPLADALAAKAASADLADVATSGAYADLSGTPASVSTVAELTDATSYDFPTLNTPVANALAAKANSADLGSIATFEGNQPLRTTDSPTFAAITGTTGTFSGAVSATRVNFGASGKSITESVVNTWGMYSDGNRINTNTNAIIGWSGGGSPSNSADAGLSRLASGSVALGNGVPGNSSGSLSLANLTASGTVKGNRFEGIATTTDAIRFSNGETRVYQNNAIVAQFQDSGLVVTNLTASGNVGIGITTPTEKLDVSGYIKASTGFRMGNYTIVSEGGNETILSNTAFYGFLFKTNNATRMKITNAGNVGIGTTSPSANLHVVGDVKIGNSSTGLTMNADSATEFLVQGVDTSGGAWNSIHLTADSLTGLYIEKDTNNVGIGTTAPAEKLDVVGNITASGTVKTGSKTVAAANALSGVAAGSLLWITNEAGGPCTAEYNGTAWVRVRDQIAISV